MNALEAYRKVRSDPLEQLVSEHAPLVRRIAHHLASRLPECVQIEDLLQAGMVGLLDAARRYDASHGAAFSTYAEVRVRGAMLDELRRGDWVPRSVHRRAREVAEAIRAIEELPERERQVLALYYDEDLNLREIGAVLGVTESRVSQIRSQALLRLRARFQG